MPCGLKAKHDLFFVICGGQFQHPGFGAGKTLRGIAESKSFPAQLPAPRIDGPCIMHLTSYVTANDEHFVIDEGEFGILIKFSFCFKLMPCMRFQILHDSIGFLYQLLPFKNICLIDLIFCFL